MKEGIFEVGFKLNGQNEFIFLSSPFIPFPIPTLKKQDNFLYLFIIKALSKLRLEGNYFNLPKFTYEKLTANIISIG